ncbi:hypothetical protein [Paenibacillus sp. 3LSP]|uniref:Uncharacterized protein n=2 Tax=Paenibacillus barengoltzii TaxID=343517 RepID=R9L8X6_9BACL|nr:hypothetical protein [Paenibacillus sp. 3LSP]EOS54811.1 hypothetical protein C812_03207 [Paenibacillus barengoltzii G22]SMF52505.1 hypothetical protein SAMN02744124_03475 [Paenibacillus barengoltzii J12]
MDEASPTKLPEAMPYGGFFCQGGEGNSIGCAPFVIIPLPQGEVEDLLNQNERDMPHLLVDVFVGERVPMLEAFF